MIPLKIQRYFNRCFIAILFEKLLHSKNYFLYYLVTAFLLNLPELAFSAEAVAPQAIYKPQTILWGWFNLDRLNMFIGIGAFCAAFLICIELAKKGKELHIRRVSGIDAIEEAVGRSTEMGKPVLYIPGIDDMNNIQTIASMVILGNVAKMTARYDTELIVPLCKPFVVPVAEETVQQGYLDAGRPDSYKPDNIRFISDEQFAYTAGVNGIMLRENPAAIIMLGSFFAESLVMAETGFSIRAIQVAGTTNLHQLPFLVVACDYCLIGEELFAASAYLSKDPKLLGTLKGSDWARVTIIFLIILGSVLKTLNIEPLTSLVNLIFIIK